MLLRRRSHRFMLDRLLDFRKMFLKRCTYCDRIISFALGDGLQIAPEDDNAQDQQDKETRNF